MTEATPKQIGYAKKLAIENPENYTKEALSKMIDERIGKSVQKEETVKAGNVFEVTPVGEHTTMYTSYAKDIFIQIIDDKYIRENKGPEQIMDYAINLVKQARDAFS